MRVMLWAVPLVAFLGYASHRASLCTVGAVLRTEMGSAGFRLLGLKETRPRSGIAQ